MRRSQKIVALIMAATMVLGSTMTSLAVWQSDPIGWWWQNDDGTWPADSWQWLDGNGDGVAECYYFDSSGYMLEDTTTPDGYTVNANGAWTVDGVTQTRIIDEVSTEDRSEYQGYNDSGQNTVNTTSVSSNYGSGDTDEYDLAYQVFEIVNDEREDNGEDALEWDSDLAACARERAEELVEKFSHTRPDGSDCFTILDENGIIYNAAGENIAMGQKTPEEVMTDWMNSSGHRANILKSSFGSMGVGCYQEGGVIYWVQLFTN